MRSASAALVACGLIAAQSAPSSSAPWAPSVAPTVRLAAALDVIGPWEDMVNATVANANEVFDAIKTADWGLPTSLGEAFTAATFIGIDIATAQGSALAAHTLDWSHLWGLQYLAGMDMGMGVVPIGAEEPAASILALLSSPMSGVLMGLIGPLLSPGVAMLNSAESVVGSLVGGDFEAALQGLLAAPAEVVGAFFNGATLNLDVLLPVLSDLLQVPAGNEIISASFDFGGLFSPGVTESGGVGGSLYNSLGLDLVMVGMPMPYSAPGEGIGLLGSLVDLLDVISPQVG